MNEVQMILNCVIIATIIVLFRETFERRDSINFIHEMLNGILTRLNNLEEHKDSNGRK